MEIRENVRFFKVGKEERKTFGTVKRLRSEEGDSDVLLETKERRGRRRRGSMAGGVGGKWEHNLVGCNVAIFYWASDVAYIFLRVF